MVFSLPVSFLAVTIPNHPKGLIINIQCRGDKGLAKRTTERKMFYTGGNSSCRAHIRQHYELYKKRCEDGNIRENHHALPRPLYKQLQELKRNPNAKQQGKLDGVFEKEVKPQEFTREGVLDAVGKFVACDDQVSSRMIKTNGSLQSLLGTCRGKQRVVS
jgi:hypothetical protein